MPRGDGTGPLGMGSMSGRRSGYCAGFDMPGYANTAPGYGFGRGRGFGFGPGGRGRRNRFHATGLPRVMSAGGYGSQAARRETDNEREVLRGRADMLQAELESLRQRLDEIEAVSSAR